MGTIKQIKERYEILTGSLMDVVAKEVSASSDVIMNMNQDQLLYGRNALGEELTPGYLSDPYFKTFEKAREYFYMKMDWEAEHKGRIYYFGIQLFPEKDRNTPNLLVNGNWFFNHFFIEVNKETYTIGSTGVASPDIELKYGKKIFGLAPQSKQYYYRHWLLPVILKHLKE
jgi:hypothetical protein